MWLYTSLCYVTSLVKGMLEKRFLKIFCPGEYISPSLTYVTGSIYQRYRNRSMGIYVPPKKYANHVPRTDSEMLPTTLPTNESNTFFHSTFELAHPILKRFVFFLQHVHNAPGVSC